nr:prolyl oligopeptidase family serine peptidase [Xanthomonas oryzae]
MGTANRSKAFHDVAWKNLGDSGFADRIAWHRALAAKDPSYDISRVGIYGASAGGQSTLGALERHPEFYKWAWRLRGATTTAWTRSAGTSSGWAGRWTRATWRRPAWSMRASCKATCC